MLYFFNNVNHYPILELVYFHNSIAAASFSAFQKRPNFDDNEIFKNIKDYYLFFI